MTMELKPCPFCGSICTSDEYGFDHPQTDKCLLSYASFAWPNAELWNTRAEITHDNR